MVPGVSAGGSPRVSALPHLLPSQQGPAPHMTIRRLVCLTAEGEGQQSQIQRRFRLRGADTYRTCGNPERHGPPRSEDSRCLHMQQALHKCSSASELLFHAYTLDCKAPGGLTSNPVRLVGRWSRNSCQHPLPLTPQKPPAPTNQGLPWNGCLLI